MNNKHESVDLFCLQIFGANNVCVLYHIFPRIKNIFQKEYRILLESETFKAPFFPHHIEISDGDIRMIDGA